MKCDELEEWYAGQFSPSAKVYGASDVDAAIAELKAENSELKAKLESVQASMYCDVVDANMENRRLKRALWLAMANRASEKVDLFWYARASTELLNINGRPDRIPEPKGWWRQLKATEWIRIWQEVERKCKVKAEEYK